MPNNRGLKGWRRPTIIGADFIAGEPSAGLGRQSVLRPRPHPASVAPGEMGDHEPKALSGEHAVWLSQRIRTEDFTLRGLVAELAGGGLKVARRSVWELVRHGCPAGMGGSRLTAKVPHGRRKTRTFLAALHHDRIDAPWFIEGPIDGESFRTYVEKVLLPTLRPGDIVVMDNLGSPKARSCVNSFVRQAPRSSFCPNTHPT